MKPYKAQIHGSLSFQVVVPVDAETAATAMADALALLSNRPELFQKALAEGNATIALDVESLKVIGAEIEPVQHPIVEEPVAVKEIFKPYRVKCYTDSKRQDEDPGAAQDFTSQAAAEAYAQTMVSASNKFAFAEVIETMPSTPGIGEAPSMRIASFHGLHRGGWEVGYLHGEGNPVEILRTYLTEAQARHYFKQKLIRSFSEKNDNRKAGRTHLVLIDNLPASAESIRQQANLY